MILAIYLGILYRGGVRSAGNLAVRRRSKGGRNKLVLVQICISFLVGFAACFKVVFKVSFWFVLRSVLESVLGYI